MNIYKFYNKPTSLDNWHTDDPNNTGIVEYRNKDGKLHKKDGPAIIWPNGREYWYRNGEFHREDGPALIYPDGYKSWYLNGESHREDGPAEIWPDGRKQWYLNGKRIIETSSQNYK